MFVHYRTKGFVLQKRDRGEADQLFTIYTKDFGKLFFLAKAARKIHSKLRAGLPLFALTEIEFIQGRAHRTVTDAIVLERFEGIRRSLPKLKIAYRIGEVLSGLVKEEEGSERVWGLLHQTLAELNAFPSGTRSLPLYYYFFWNLVALAGFEPSLYRCVSCQKKIGSGPLYFDSAQGGMICKTCFRGPGSGQRIDPDLVKILRIVLRGDKETFRKIKITPLHLRSLRSVSSRCYSHLLEDFQ